MRRAAFIAALILAACASDPMGPVRESFVAGDYAAARDQLLRLQQAESSDAHLYGLELGVVQQALGDPEAAIAELRKSRDTMDRLAKGNYTDWAASTFLDDRSRTYPGADYEHVMVRAMLALADLMAGGHDAFAYGLQVLEKQQEIIAGFDEAEGENPKAAYKLVAFGNYIRAILSEGDPRGRSEARKEYAKVRELAPQFEYGAADLERVTNGPFAPKGFGAVHILALVGRGPQRVEVEEKVLSRAITIAQAIWSVRRGQVVIPNIPHMALPALAFQDGNPDALAVFAGDRRVGRTAVLTDVEATARAEFDAMRPYVMARALVRKLMKVTAAEAGKALVAKNRHDKNERETAGTDAIMAGIDLLGNLWSASEAADLRCWNFLPASFQVLRIELPEGEHDIAVRPVRGGQVAGPEQRVRVGVLAGYNTYVFAMVPTLGGGPPLMSSRPAASDRR